MEAPADLSISTAELMLDETGRELVMLATRILSLLSRLRVDDVYDTMAGPALQTALTRDYFKRSLTNHYLSLAGVKFTRRLAMYAPPGYFGQPTGAPSRWQLIVAAEAPTTSFNETLSFEKVDGKWKLAFFAVNESF